MRVLQSYAASAKSPGGEPIVFIPDARLCPFSRATCQLAISLGTCGHNRTFHCSTLLGPIKSAMLSDKSMTSVQFSHVTISFRSFSSTRVHERYFRWLPASHHLRSKPSSSWFAVVVHRVQFLTPIVNVLVQYLNCTLHRISSNRAQCTVQ